MTRPMPAPAVYPTGTAQFDPRVYLMHFKDDRYIGPFDTLDQAALYRRIRGLSHWAVVRTSKPRKAHTPGEADASYKRGD